jgi:hypothetical protein
MRRKRRFRLRGKGLGPTQNALDEKEKERRENQIILMVFSLFLLASGALTLLLANQTESVVRRFSSPAIQSVSALKGAANGKAVVLRGRIDPQAPVRTWGLAIYDREHRDHAPPVWGRFGGRQSPVRTWGRSGGFHPPFTLLTGGGRVSIVGGGYAIERPTTERGLGDNRVVGFVPDDEVLVIGDTAKGGVAAGRVFGGKWADFQKSLDDERAFVPGARAIGYVLTGVGIVLLALWVRKSDRPRLWLLRHFKFAGFAP